MKKKLLAMLLAAVMAVGLLAAAAFAADAATSGTCGRYGDEDSVTWTLVDGVLTISGTGAMYGYYPDGVLPPWYRSYRDDIRTVIVNDGVTAMGDDFTGYAFLQCSNLTSVTIPASVTAIGTGTFSRCTSLTSVTIPDGVTSIEQYTFSGCASLTSVTIPASVTVIYTFAFEDCTSLTDVYYGGTESQWKQIIINTNYGGNAPLNDAVIHCTDGDIRPAEPTTPETDSDFVIVNGWLKKYTGEGGDVVIPGSVTRIDTNAFDNCTSMTSVTIPDSVTFIDSHAFGRCTGLTGVTIPDSVTSIGSGAFYGCTGLTGVTIGSGVTSIGSSAFTNCTSLTGVTIPNSVTSIDDSVFSGCTSLTSVTIGSGVTTIYSEMFSGCTSLTSVTIPNGVTSIDGGAFRNCTSLTGVTIPNGVTSIGGGAFENCTSLTSVTIPNSVTSVGYNAFYGCTGLTSVTIGSGVTTIYSETFSDCTSLTSVTIPAGVTSIDAWAFYGCTSLTSVTIPASVTYINHDAFGNCESLTDVYYGGSDAQWGEIQCDNDVFGTTAFSNGGQESAGLANVTVIYNSAVPEQPTERTEPETPAITFTDVGEDSWCADAVVWAAKNGITNGYPGGVFAPDTKCTNEQILMFLYRAAEKKGAASADDGEAAVSWAQGQNMIGDSLDKEANCTRADAVMYIWQALGSPAPTGGSSFTDVPADAAYADAVAWAVEKGVTTGYSASHFGPKDTCTRGQIVTFLHRALAD